MPESIKSMIDIVAENTPFLAMAAGRPQFNTTRILEALIIAGVVAMASRFVIVTEVKTELQYVKTDISEMKVDYKSGLAEVMAEIRTIKGDIYVPKFEMGKINK